MQRTLLSLQRLFRAARVAVACAALLALAACGPDHPPSPAPLADAPVASAVPPRRALWVLCEGSARVLEDEGRIERLLIDARALGVSDLFVQVYRGGRAWFDSSRADPAPYRAAVAAVGSDPLSLLLTRAHAAGMRVHAWVNVLSLARNREAPVLRALGPGAVHVDQRGRSLLDYPDFEVPPPDRDWYRMGTRGLYLDPAAPGVADWLADTFEELVARYPELDGLHLDYIRHPGVLPFSPGSRFGLGLNFGHGAGSRKRFRRETGLEPPDPSTPRNASRWDAWQRQGVTNLVARIRGAAQRTHPGLTISAAVISYTDRAYLSLAQDWRRWLEEGLIDFAVPMAYTLDDRLLRYQLDNFARGPHAERIWAGLGVWLFAGRPERARTQLELAREAGVAGVALFSYDALSAAPGLLSALTPVEAAAPPGALPRGE